MVKERIKQPKHFPQSRQIAGYLAETLGYAIRNTIESTSTDAVRKAAKYIDHEGTEIDSAINMTTAELMVHMADAIDAVKVQQQVMTDIVIDMTKEKGDDAGD